MESMVGRGLGQGNVGRASAKQNAEFEMRLYQQANGESSRSSTRPPMRYTDTLKRHGESAEVPGRFRGVTTVRRFSSENFDFPQVYTPPLRSHSQKFLSRPYGNIRRWRILRLLSFLYCSDGSDGLLRTRPLFRCRAQIMLCARDSGGKRGANIPACL